MINNKLPQLTTMSKEEINKRFDGIANPNIIANGDFVNLVNTTGKKEFLYMKGGTEIFDGWKIVSGYLGLGKVIVQDDGILLDSGTAENSIFIGYDLTTNDSAQLSEKTITVSREYVDIGNTKSNFGMQVWKDNTMIRTVFNNQLDKYTFLMPKLNDGEFIRVLLMAGNKNGEILKTLFKKVKLEIGDKATPLGYVSQAQKQLETDGVPLLYGGTEIKANEDLNNYVNIGNYCCSYNDTVVTLKNIPPGLKYAFCMLVKSGNGNIVSDSKYNYFIQEIETYFGEIYKRPFEINNGSYTFGDWIKMATDNSAQLSTIENLVRKSNQDIIDEYTLELIEQGVIK